MHHQKEDRTTCQCQRRWQR